jgi:protein-L-isoaspartate(D-aspartate) O-methyltransferase
MDLDEIRQFYAEEIRFVANIQTEAIVNALAKVPRENFLGPGPWLIANPDTGISMGDLTKRIGYRTTIDADPRHLYHNVPIAIDPARKLNNGHPGSLATWLDALELKTGDRVVHVGCGVGYYTAIIAEVVGSTGQVTGVELDPDLATRARENLAHYDFVQVVQANGSDYDPPPSDAIFINAGATYPRPAWLDSLRPGGRLLLPLTIGADSEAHGIGFILRVKREGESFTARFLGSVMIFPCIGSRDATSNQQLQDAMKRGNWAAVQSVRREPHEADETCWLHHDRGCLSTLPAAASPPAAERPN